MLTTRTYFLLSTGITWAGLHMLALALDLYWVLWWFDLPMHFIGGAVIALTWLALYDLQVPYLPLTPSYRATLTGVVLAVVVWELFELWAGIPMASDYGIDTTIDVALGLLGGHVGYQLGERLSAL